MITSPVVRGESLKFKEEGVRDILKDVFLPWYNALRLLIQSADQLNIEKQIQFVYDQKSLYSSMISNRNIMDTWIVSYTQTLLNFVKQEMDGSFSFDLSSIFFDTFSSLFRLSSLYGCTTISEIHRYVDELVREIE